MSVSERLYCLYKGDTGPTKYWSIWIAALASVGMILKAGDDTSDIHLLLDLAPWWVWALILAYISISRCIAVLWWHGNVLTRVLTPLMSIVLWGFFLAAQWVAPNFGLGLLFFVPALQETWILSRVFWDERLLWTKS